MAGKYTPIYGFPQPQDSDIIDAKDIADLAQKVENELDKGIPIPAMKEDGYWYLKDINTGRKWKPEKGKDYYTEADQAELRQFAKDTAESVKTQAESDLATYKANVEADIKQRLNTSAANIKQAKTDALKAISNKETALNQNIDTAKTEIDQKITDAEQIKKNITQIQGAVSQSETNINKAKSDVEALKTTIDTTAETIANNKLAAEKAKKGAETAKKQSTDALTTIQGLAQGINTTAEQVTQNATSASESKTAAETAKSKAQEIADSLQGTVDNANQAADRANAAAKKADQAAQTVQPDATNTSKGIVQIGEGIEVTDGIISVDLSGKSDKTHTHKISGITGLDKALADAGKVKSVNGATGDVKINAVPSGGTTGQVLKKTSSGYGWGTDNNTKYTHPSSHPISMIEGLQAALDGKKDLTTHWIRNKDTRDVNLSPVQYIQDFTDGLVLEFKQYKTIGTPRGSKGGSYNFLATYIPFRDARDFSGGLPTQMAFADDRVYVRGSKSASDASAWGPWRELANTDDVKAVKTTIVNSLTSSSTTSALSANQGKVLNEKITKTDKKFGEVSQIKVLTQAQYNALSTKDPGTLYLVKEG